MSDKKTNNKPSSKTKVIPTISIPIGDTIPKGHRTCQKVYNEALQRIELLENKLSLYLSEDIFEGLDIIDKHKYLVLQYFSEETYLDKASSYAIVYEKGEDTPKSHIFTGAHKVFSNKNVKTAIARRLNQLNIEKSDVLLHLSMALRQNSDVRSKIAASKVISDIQGFNAAKEVVLTLKTNISDFDSKRLTPEENRTFADLLKKATRND